VPNKSAKVAPAKDERRVRGGDWVVEVGSSAIVRDYGRTDGEVRIYAAVCCCCSDWQTKWLASSGTWFGLVLTKCQQEPVIFASVGVCCGMRRLKQGNGRWCSKVWW
jgi:hypothetical protein